MADAESAAPPVEDASLTDVKGVVQPVRKPRTLTLEEEVDELYETIELYDARQGRLEEMYEVEKNDAEVNLQRTAAFWIERLAQEKQASALAASEAVARAAAAEAEKLASVQAASEAVARAAAAEAATAAAEARATAAEARVAAAEAAASQQLLPQLRSLIDGLGASAPPAAEPTQESSGKGDVANAVEPAAPKATVAAPEKAPEEKAKEKTEATVKVKEAKPKAEVKAEPKAPKAAAKVVTEKMPAKPAEKKADTQKKAVEKPVPKAEAPKAEVAEAPAKAKAAEANVEAPTPMTTLYEEAATKNAARGADDPFTHVAQYEVADGAAVMKVMEYEQLGAMSQLPEDDLDVVHPGYKALKTSELRAKLAQLGWMTQGVRTELIKRYEEALRLERAKFFNWDPTSCSWVPSTTWTRKTTPPDWPTGADHPSAGP